jgi:hypothetical protein
MPDPLSDQRVLRFLDLQVRKQGYLKVISAPVAVLAAIGGAFALLGNNWLLFGTVVGAGTCILVLLLLAVEHLRASRLQEEVTGLNERLSLVTTDLEGKVQQNAATIEAYSRQFEKIQELIGSVRWITERMAVCCSMPSSNGETQQGSAVGVENACDVSEFNDLENVLLDYAYEALGESVRRLVIYYGDETRLTVAHKPGWRNSHPRILVAGQPKTQLEVNAALLLDELKTKPEVYVPDVTHPTEEQSQIIDIVPDHQKFRTLACFRLASLPSVWAESTEKAKLLGILLVQDARVDALGDMYERQFFTVLANVLATALLGVRLNLTRAGQN